VDQTADPKFPPDWKFGVAGFSSPAKKATNETRRGSRQ
jgi:hypothetical protein